MKLKMGVYVASIFLMVSASAQVSSARKQDLPVSVYVAPFATRGSVDPDIVASFRELFEESFVNAFAGTGTYKVLNRDSIEKIVAGAQNEQALSSVDDITPALKTRLRIAKADGVIFGQVIDDRDSGEVIVGAKLQSFDSVTYWNQSTSMKRGLIHDRASRKDAMEQLVRSISGSLQEKGKPESDGPGSQTVESAESSTSHSIEARPRGCMTPPKGLVGWWPGDGNMNDIIGDHNPSDASAVSYLPGEVGYGFTFGTKAWIRIPTSPPLQNQRFTWAAWVRVDGLGSKVDGPGSKNDSFGSVILGQPYRDAGKPTVAPVQLAWRSMDDRFVFAFGVTEIDKLVSEHSFPPGSFYLIAAEYDGKQYRLFVNGALEGSINLQQSVPYSSSAPWLFGQGGLWALDKFPITWNGVIDEVQAFNRDLTQSEIEAIYNAGTKGECKPAH